MKGFKRILRLIAFAIIVIVAFKVAEQYGFDKIFSKLRGENEIDAAITKDVLFVNKNNPLPGDYAPAELVNLYEQGRAFKLASSEIYLERQTFEAANAMFAKAAEDGVSEFILTSGYRTRDRQAELYADDPSNAAAPGTSEHETGMCFDVTTYYDTGTFADTAQFKWLYDNCWDYGFILRYPDGKEGITGFTYEPWHYRYIGVEAARAVRASGLTLEEFMGKK